MELAHVVHRAATNPVFAAQLLHDPHTTLNQTQLPLDEQQLAVLLSVLHEHPHWRELCSPQMTSPIETPWRD
jgi:hypothetical protein